MSAVLVLSIALLCALAGFLRGLAGFGFAVLAVPAVALMVGPRDAVVLNSLVGLVLSGYSFFVYRHSVEYHRLLQLIGFSILFVPIGAVFVYVAPEALILQLLGLVVVFLTLITMMSTERMREILSNRMVGFVLCGIGGLLTGAYTAGGPPIVAYLYNSDKSLLRAKANLQFFFVVLTTTVVAIHSVSGRVQAGHFVAAFILAPIATAGARLGIAAARRVPSEKMRLGVDLGLISLGSYIFLSNL